MEGESADHRYVHALGDLAQGLALRPPTECRARLGDPARLIAREPGRNEATSGNQRMIVVLS